MDEKRKDFLVFAKSLFFLALIMATPYSFACTAPAGTQGQILYNSDQKVFQYCTGTQWRRMNQTPGSGSGGCALTPSGTLSEGQIAYLDDQQVMVGCAGNVLRSFGSSEKAKDWVNVSLSINPNSGDHGCGVKKDGSLWCWGSNGNGRTGLGTASGVTSAPARVSAGTTWTLARAGDEHSCGVRTNGTLWCWGSNGSGRTGLGSSSGTTLSPAQVSGGGTWKTVDVSSFSCAIKSDNSLWCFGPNSSGQLGDNSTTGKTIPTAVDGGGSWLQVDVAQSHACAIKTDNTLWCWGTNGSGRTGLGTTVGNTLVPTQVSGGGTWSYVGTGGDQAGTCGIKTDGSLWCWGSIGGTSTPAAVSPGTTWKAVDIGRGFQCAIRSDDTMWCWGGNSSGQLGDGTYTSRASPTQVLGGGTWQSVATGYFHTCGVRLDGRLLCWGDYQSYQIGLGLLIDSLTPHPLGAGLDWTLTSAGNNYSCSIRDTGSLMCWGTNTNGRAGIGSTTSPLEQPTEVSGAGNWIQVSAGDIHACGIRSDLSLRCWGSNANGRTGLNTATGDATSPTAVSGGGSWSRISAGLTHSCGIRTDGKLYCWGANTNGRTGLGTATGNTLVPTEISGGGTWREVATGTGHTCAINNNEDLYCWGLNTHGQLGDGTSGTDRLTPTLVLGGHKWRNIYAGRETNSFSCGILKDATARCWGSNANGRTGLATTVGNTLTPAAVSGGGAWNSLSLGWSHACGLLANEMVSCWGTNANGRTGRNTTAGDTTSPTAISFVARYKSVAAGGSHTCVISYNGSQSCFGFNGAMALGFNENTTQINVSQPTLVACSSPTGRPGRLIFNSTSQRMQYCNGSRWIGL